MAEPAVRQETDNLTGTQLFPLLRQTRYVSPGAFIVVQVGVAISPPSL